MKEPKLFDCDRTCPFFERRDLCRFNPLFKALGNRATVNSHTTTVDLDLTKSPDSLRAAVEALNGKWLGHGNHKLYGSNHESGYGFTLPGWSYTLVANEKGIQKDDYRKSRDAVTMDALSTEYALRAAETAAALQGWSAYRNGNTLEVIHPSGGTLTVGATGEIDANGFIGQGCHDAAQILIGAMGDPDEFTPKPEFNMIQEDTQNRF